MYKAVISIETHARLWISCICTKFIENCLDLPSVFLFFFAKTVLLQSDLLQWFDKSHNGSLCVQRTRTLAYLRFVLLEICVSIAFFVYQFYRQTNFRPGTARVQNRIRSFWWNNFNLLSLRFQVIISIRVNYLVDFFFGNEKKREK